MARPTDGLKHVDRLSTAPQVKKRLRVILEVLHGERTVQDACRTLHISEALFHRLRHQALTAAAQGLTPGKPGRPRKEPVVEPTEVERLREDNARLREALWAAEVREEIALTMPHVLHRRGKKPGA